MRFTESHYLRKKPGENLAFAERVGFKPTVRLGRTPDFESGPFDHSGIFPDSGAKLHKKHVSQTPGTIFITLE